MSTLTGDHSSWRTRTNTMLWAAGAALVSAWHLAAAATVPGVDLADVQASVEALVTRAPNTTYAAFAGLLLAAFVAACSTILVWGRLRRSKRGHDGHADATSVRAALGTEKARASAAQTRPGLSAREVKTAVLSEVGLDLGITQQGTGENIVFPFEAHLCVTGPTGSGKSVTVMIPAALSAPGALVVTSNEVSILDVIAQTRTARGKVWVFDPLGRSHWPEPMVFDPVAGCEEGETALARGIAFAAGLGGEGSGSSNAGFFKRNAVIALSRMLHGAALGGRDMSEVLQWAVNLDTDATIPAALIRNSTDERAEKSWASMLEAVATGADETVASSRQTLQQGVEPLTLRKVARWVTPAVGVPVFDAAAFVSSTDTLVLISDDSSSTNVGPLCTMLFQEVMDAIKAHAPLASHGRLDPPLRIVGDEIANIAPIEKLPELSSEVRKLGVELVLGFQSDLQAKSRWGEDRGHILLEQMAAELVLPGLKSPTALRRLAQFAGKIETENHTSSYGEGGTSRGGSTSLREQDVLRADEVRTMKDGTAALIWRNERLIMVDLTPWYRRRDAAQLTQASQHSAARRRAHAQTQRDTAAGAQARGHTGDTPGTVDS